MKPKQLFKKSIYNDSDNADIIEETIEKLSDILDEIEDFKETQDTYIMIQDLIRDLKPIQDELDEMRIDEWADDTVHQNREYYKAVMPLVRG